MLHGTTSNVPERLQRAGIRGAEGQRGIGGIFHTQPFPPRHRRHVVRLLMPLMPCLPPGSYSLPSLFLSAQPVIHLHQKRVLLVVAEHAAELVEQAKRRVGSVAGLTVVPHQEER